MNRIRRIRRLAAVLAGLAGALLAFAAAAPAALAWPDPPLPRGCSTSTRCCRRDTGPGLCTGSPPAPP